MKKRCPKCEIPKDKSSFYKDTSKVSGLSSYCRDCQCSRSRLRWETKNSEVRAANKAYYKTHKAEFIEYGRQRKLEVIAAYGSKCVCCGESTPEFMTIDHIYNDGAAERKLYSGASGIYAFLKRNGYPKDRYQLLCWNCNCAKHFNGGVCPHEVQQEVSI